MRLSSRPFASHARFARMLMAVALVSHGMFQPVLAQAPAAVDPSNVVSLSASSSMDVPQDWLSISLNTTKEGSEASVVQSQLKSALDAALLVAKAAAQPQLLEVRTGRFSLYPRYGSSGKISGWQGTAEMVIEGRDFTRISATAGNIQTLTLGQVAFSLSREAERKLEGDVQRQAIERFKARADQIAQNFGFKSYVLREVSVSSVDQGAVQPYPRAMAMQAKASVADAPVPVEAGKSTVSVTVSGSIQLR